MAKTYTFTANTVNTDLFFGKYSRFYTYGADSFDPWAEMQFDSNPRPEGGVPRKPIAYISSDSKYWSCKIYFGAYATELSRIAALPSGSITSITLTTQATFGTFYVNSPFYWDTATNAPDLTTPNSDFISDHKTGGLKTQLCASADSIEVDISDYGIPDSYSWLFRYSGNTYSYLSAPVTLTIITTENDYSYTLSYDANGGSGAPSSQTGSNTQVSPSYTFTISNTIPVRSGYNFLKWNTSNDGTGTDYNPNESITVTSDGTTTLYAIWKIANILRIVNSAGTDLDMYTVYIVENNVLVPYKVTIVNSTGTGLDDYT